MKLGRDYVPGRLPDGTPVVVDSQGHTYRLNERGEWEGLAPPPGSQAAFRKAILDDIKAPDETGD